MADKEKTNNQKVFTKLPKGTACPPLEEALITGSFSK